jgi:hypothetical protein
MDQEKHGGTVGETRRKSSIGMISTDERAFSDNVIAQL